MIHQYKLSGYNIVLDVYSGSVHVVDDVAYDIIGMYEGHTKEEITKAILEKYADNPEVTAEEIADILELDPNFVKEICQIAVPMAPNYDLDKIYETYHTMK